MGTAIYLKCGDNHNVGSNCVNLNNGNKGRTDLDKQVVIYPDAVVHVGSSRK
jgi:hypothetical protein